MLKSLSISSINCSNTSGSLELRKWAILKEKSIQKSKCFYNSSRCLKESFVFCNEIGWGSVWSLPQMNNLIYLITHMCIPICTMYTYIHYNNIVLYINAHIISAIWVCIFLKKKRHNISVSTSRCSNQWSFINLYNSRW